MPVSGNPGFDGRHGNSSVQPLFVSSVPPSVLPVALIIPTPPTSDPVLSPALNFLATTEQMLTARARAGAIHQVRRIVRRVPGVAAKDPADAQGFTLAFHALAPPPPQAPPAWAATINKSISTRWITFIRLGDCYPDERESRLMGKLILQ